MNKSERKEKKLFPGWWNYYRYSSEAERQLALSECDNKLTFLIGRPKSSIDEVAYAVGFPKVYVSKIRNCKISDNKLHEISEKLNPDNIWKDKLIGNESLIVLLQRFEKMQNAERDLTESVSEHKDEWPGMEYGIPKPKSINDLVSGPSDSSKTIIEPDGQVAFDNAETAKFNRPKAIMEIEAMNRFLTRKSITNKQNIELIKETIGTLEQVKTNIANSSGYRKDDIIECTREIKRIELKIDHHKRVMKSNFIWIDLIQNNIDNLKKLLEK